MLHKYVFDVTKLTASEIDELYENLDRHAFMVGVEKYVDRRTASLYALFESDDTLETLLSHPKGFSLPKGCSYFKYQ